MTDPTEPTPRPTDPADPAGPGRPADPIGPAGAAGPAARTGRPAVAAVRAPRPPRHRARRALTFPVALATVTVAGVTALGAGGFAVAAGSAPADATGRPPKPAITDGTLEWGVKESFRRYLASPAAHGTITTSDGATQATGNGPFTFSAGAGDYDTARHAVEARFRGRVHFTGHGGALDIAFSDVRVSTEGTRGSITLDVTTPDGTSDDVAVATLDLAGIKPGTGQGGAVRFENIPATLTADGAKAFNGMYREGQALDPATLTVSVGSAPTGTPTPGPTPEPTGPTTPAPTPPATPGPKPTGTAPTDGPTATPTTGTPTGTPTGGPGPDTTPAPPAADGTIADGTLDWGVKKSFREYVTGPVAHGAVTVSGGAREHGDGFRFPSGQGTYDEDAGTLDAGFDGAVRFTGHEGQLDLRFSDLKVRIDGRRGSLVADVSAKDRATGKVTESDDLTVAELALTEGLTAEGDVVRVSRVPAELTRDGAAAFGGFYRPGDALDPVDVVVTTADGAALPGGAGGSGGTGGDGTGGSGGGGDTVVTGAGTSGSGGVVDGGAGADGSLAATGSPVPAAALAGGAGLLVAGGTAAVLTARRRASRTAGPAH
ncbi:HtaA domain-containing protein [Streptomyces pactum]|uniref:HtaA domain-containing protein n=1 Tax=Streptomyces pactum TaxID=68249 RepID=UPI0036F9FA30